MYEIRFVIKSDLLQLVDLCAAHAQYEHAPYDKSGKVEQLGKDLFCALPKLQCLIVASDDELTGFATYMKQYATWDAGEYIYLDCLFLKPAARGQGLGELLVERLKQETANMGLRLIQWQTPEFNAGAIKFYKRIGATSKSKERFFLEL